MKHLVVGGLAALAIGLAGAPMAGADANDREFIKATDKVIMLHTGSTRMGTGSDIPEFLLNSGSIPPTRCATCWMTMTLDLYGQLYPGDLDRVADALNNRRRIRCGLTAD